MRVFTFLYCNQRRGPSGADEIRQQPQLKTGVVDFSRLAKSTRTRIDPRGMPQEGPVIFLHHGKLASPVGTLWFRHLGGKDLLRIAVSRRVLRRVLWRLDPNP